jgi:DNA polymerase I-like protein with 3'-5' exonuclease and polymerase domains
MFAHYTINEIQGSHGLKRQAIDRYWAPLYDDTLKDALHAARKAGTIPTRVKSRSRGRVDALGLTEDEDEEKETKAKTGDDRKEALDIPIEAWGVPELRQMVMKYCGADVDYTLRLAEDLTEEMEQEDVLGVHDRLLLPAGVHFAWLEEVGMKVDVEYHNRLGAEWQQAQDEICRRLFEISESWDWPGTPSGRPWWSSHVRLKRYLYDELRLRKMISSRRDGKLTQNEVLQEIQDLEEEADEDAVDYWRTASSAVFSNMKPDSTNTYMLFWLASQHEFPRTMVDWRILDKKLGTYYHGYRNIMRRGGRIHPRFRITGARTGRVSCTDPNIHGVARKKEIKRIFVADEDYVILYSDRSQAEIRMLAHMSGDESLRHACESEDMHFAIACDLFQLTPEQLRAKGKEQVEFMRRAAKTIAFGIIYGRMPDSLAPQLGCTVQEATVYRERFLSRMRQARQWIEAQKRRVLHEREVTSIYGRKRRFPIILDNAHKSEVERQAVNAPIQGAVSDMTLEDMLKIVRELDKRGIRVLPWPHVHDGQMLQVQKSKIGEALKIARDVLDNPSFQTRVRFAYELATGPGWADLETVFKG